MIRYFYCDTSGIKELAEWEPECWVEVMHPDFRDVEFLTKRLGVPIDFIEDIADFDERPRADKDGKWLTTIMRIPIRTGEANLPYSTMPLGIAADGGEVFVTICHGKNEMLTDFVNHTRKKQINIYDRFELILRLLYSSTVWFQKYLKEIYGMVNIAESELKKSIRNEDLIRVMNLQKTLVYFNTSIRGNEVMVGRLQSIFSSEGYSSQDLMEDLVIEIKQAYNTVNIYNNILTNTMDAFASIISNNVNTIMKRMTSISIVLMVPTLIASFYGMNVDIFIDKQHYAFVFIIIISLVLSWLAFIYFKKIKWF